MEFSPEHVSTVIRAFVNPKRFPIQETISEFADDAVLF